MDKLQSLIIVTGIILTRNAAASPVEDTQVYTYHDEVLETILVKFQSMERELKVLRSKLKSQQETSNRKFEAVVVELNRQNDIIQKQDNKIQRLYKVLLDSEIKPQKSTYNRSQEYTTQHQSRLLVDKRNTDERISKKERETQKRLLGISSTTSPKTSPVAFSAYFSTNEVHLTSHHTLVFDVVQTNTGNGYNKHSGSFIVPRAGLYVFTWTLITESSGEICTNLVINGVNSGYSYANDNWQQTTSIEVIQMEQGDTVLVRTNNYSGCNQAGSIKSDKWRRSNFSGWLIG
ncbi:C1QL [Mytilus coruscus]|uniref:C1QL n=1 Tax=Mytilus coruscus TaxID=42192 RepID=A0A6J8AJF3_MYTCO|nr:C1QL [Mytilus coruscus]